MPSIVSDQPDQPGQSLAGVDWIEGQGFERAGEPDGLDGCRMRHAIGGAGVPCDHLDVALIEAVADQIGCGTCEGDNIRTHALGFGIDINADDSRLGHRNRRADDKAGVRPRATGAMDDRGRPNAKRTGLIRDLYNCRSHTRSRRVRLASPIRGNTDSLEARTAPVFVRHVVEFTKPFRIERLEGRVLTFPAVQQQIG
jgi:hypothetical protein